MNPEVHQESIELAGRTLSLETGKLARLAGGSITARYGDTVVLATAVISDPREDADFFPLTVDYEEKLYAGGLIKGSPWVKREGRPRDEALLNARMIDRSVRPLFPKDFRNEVQIIVTVLSVDMENDPSVIGLVAASAALHVAGAPWKGPVGGIRIGRVNGTSIVNPQLKTEQEYSRLDLMLASTKEKVVMIEVGAEEVPEEEIIESVEQGFEVNQGIIAMIERLAEKVGTKTIEYEPTEMDADLHERVEAFIQSNFDFPVNETQPKEERKATREDFLEKLFGEFEGKTTKSQLKELFDVVRRSEIRRLILEDGKRIDGRAMDVVRPLYMEVGLLPRTHGSAVFQRGDTQALTVTTLGSTSLEQLIESMTGEETKRYIHHYNFPPFSTGETGRVGSPKRREIGHGALAERALEAVVPSEAEFPYTIRVVSEILSSDGSSSMAATCGSTLSLMDAGVPIKEPVAGIAMGLVTDKEGEQVILTDILGVEDHIGDMDFKVTGTKNGITAMQVDVKIDGLTFELIKQILKRSKTGRLHILDQMMQTIGQPREKLSQYAPKVVSLKIKPDQIGEVIGPGGKVIKAIQADTDTVISIEEDGSVYITGVLEEGLQNAKKRIEGITKEPEVGEMYEGEVKRILDFGAFVEYLPGKDGLVHVSEISDEYVKNVRDYLTEGQEVKVKVVEIDSQGRVNLSIRKAEEQ